MATQEWCRRVCIMALVGSLFVLTEVAGKPGPVGYGSYDNYNHGPSYNLIPEQPVVKKVVDFYAKPKYSFGYEVEDYYNQLSHGRWEIRDGDVTQGQYRVLLPDGRIQHMEHNVKADCKETQFTADGTHFTQDIIALFTKTDRSRHRHHIIQTHALYALFFLPPPSSTDQKF
ncbi:unnamed protein product [Allacma fusca]|uniref:Uncharacterized protein n=1 Tax=Allacma fusca TaxID=39272 RepID=A0A8J2P9X5_9HEXA|nr:unnamed protein product [Allacma fusca]